MELPFDFCSKMKALLKEEYNDFLSAVALPEPVSIRVNRRKYSAAPPLAPVAWCGDGYYLDQRPSFTFDPLFHAGAYYVQEASSMFLAQAVEQLSDKPIKALDLCAAPGGKSTLLLSSLPAGSLLVANEVIRNRAQILNDNIKKWGYPNAVVSNNDPSRFSQLPAYFDFILADVPCSGEGMFRKDSNAIAEWSADNVSLCAARQQRIIKEVWTALKPGGLLVYSTCTYNTKENEENIDWICRELGAESVELTVNKEWNIGGALTGNRHCYRFFPHRVKGEGFFLSVLKKNGETSVPVEEKQVAKPKTGKERGKPIPSFPYRDWLEHTPHFAFDISEQEVIAYPEELREDMLFLTKTLKPISAGLQVATLKGREWAPAHALALSSDFARGAFPAVELSLKEVIGYLKKETVQLPDNLPAGYVLITYKDVPVGWVKNIGHRSNNLYPQEYRIRTTYTPAELTPALP